MRKPQTMIVFAGCLLAGLVIIIGASLFGVLNPKEQPNTTNPTIKSDTVETTARYYSTW